MSEKLKFFGSKGEWQSKESAVVCLEHRSDRVIITPICHMEDPGYVYQKTENAKLIAASPDLLSACISAEKYLQELHEANLLPPFPTRSELDKLNEAINKALK